VGVGAEPEAPAVDPDDVDPDDVDPDDVDPDDVLVCDVVEPVAFDPGMACATAMPIAVVAAPAMTVKATDTLRTLDRAAVRAPGLCRRAGDDMAGSFGRVGRRYPTSVMQEGGTWRRPRVR
jgi:hypothetical protein